MTAWHRKFRIDTSGWRWPFTVAAVLLFAAGLWWHQPALFCFGAVSLCFLLRRVAEEQQPDFRPNGNRSRQRSAGHSGDKPRRTGGEADTTAPDSPAPRMRATPNEHPKNTDELVDELLATGRYALLLRAETKQHLSQVHVVRAVRRLDEAMALVPGGRVLLGQLAEQSSSACGTFDVDPKLLQRNLVNVEPAYLDRFCVTNEEFQQFVDAGGYEQLEFWHEESLPALLDFVDQTGAPGPRYWSDGQYAHGEQRLPVVGVSWYEASAYAHWVGKRLPTDAEWTKAGAWPVEAAPGRIAQRRYPWGESFDMRRAHLYASGSRGPVAIDEYPAGMSVGGLHQLIGNVWEWTSTPLAELGDPTLHVSESVMSIRGGAFDSYFENQATCHYQSGDHPLSRRPNIGFRLALPMRDLEAPRSDTNESNTSEPVATAPATEGAVATFEYSPV